MTSVFGHIAGRCSAETARLLKELEDKKIELAGSEMHAHDLEAENIRLSELVKEVSDGNVAAVKSAVETQISKVRDSMKTDAEGFRKYFTGELKGILDRYVRLAECEQRVQILEAGKIALGRKYDALSETHAKSTAKLNEDLVAATISVESYKAKADAFAAEISDYKRQSDANILELTDAKAELDNAKVELETYRAQSVNTAETEKLTAQCKSYIDEIARLNDMVKLIEEKYDASERQLEEYRSQLANLQGQLANVINTAEAEVKVERGKSRRFKRDSIELSDNEYVIAAMGKFSDEDPKQYGNASGLITNYYRKHGSKETADMLQEVFKKNMWKDRYTALQIAAGQ